MTLDIDATRWGRGADAIYAGSSHSVQFYEDEAFLYSAVSDFLAAGLRAGEPVVVIATPPHRDGFASELRAKGFDVERSFEAGQLTFLDVREMLSLFMLGELPDRERFMTHIGGAIARSAASGKCVRAYGEMVDVLWRDGMPQGAIDLEELWNDLGTMHTFSLLCAYPIGNFYKESESHLFDEMCRTHSRVVPTEKFTTAENDARLSEISRLQQRAAALESEIKHRKELESALRESLAVRRQTEDALRRSERTLQDFIDHATIGMHWVGADGTILWANDAELDLLGYSRDEYVGRSIIDFHADRAVIDDILARLKSNEALHDYEARLLAKDGSIKHVALSSNVLFENGEFIHTRCFTRDVTAAKHFEDAQRRAAEENAFLLDVTTALNSSLDYQSRLRELTNVAVPRLGDWCAVDIASEDGGFQRLNVAHVDPAKTEVAFRLTRDFHRPPEQSPIMQVLRSGEPRIVSAVSEDDLRAMSQNEAHFNDLKEIGARSWMIVPMKLGDRVVGALTFVCGDSGRSYAQPQLVLAIELARRAAFAIENARLYALAQDSNRTKDEFLATLSHELRTPLTAILGWARMLTLGGLDAETTRVALDTIERSARTQASLIDDLLDLSKVVTGKLALQSELVDLAAVVANAVQTTKLAADARGITLDVAGLNERAVVTGDPTRLQQITWNLLSNAIKFSEGGGTIQVRLHRRGDRARIVVTDSGRGISPEFLPHVFEPFRQADGASSRSHGGLGLGLAIVKYLTELHGGSVTASSEGEGKGASFEVTLPIVLRRSAIVPELEDQPLIDLSGMSVLIVDDDADTRNVVAAILRRSGAEVETADSVESARSMLDRKQPSVLVTDIAMPGQDGFAMLHHAATIPVIALTAFGSPSAEENYLAAGFRAYVRKPVDPFQFARVIGNLRSADGSVTH